MTLVHVLLLVNALGLVWLLAVPAYQESERRRVERACYSNLKTITGSMEMYSLDRTTLSRLEARAQRARRGADAGPEIRQLLQDGFLQHAPNCPAVPSEGAVEYYLTTSNIGLACRIHGDVR